MYCLAFPLSVVKAASTQSPLFTDLVTKVIIKQVNKCIILREFMVMTRNKNVRP